AASMSAASGWPGSSPSGRLLTTIAMPRSASPAISSGRSWPLTEVLSSSRRIIGLPAALGRVRRGRRRRGRRCSGRSRNVRQPVIIDVRLDARVVAGKRAVHGGIILGVTARQDHLAETLAVGPGQPAVLLEPGERVLAEHPGPRISIITRRIAVAPDVQEVARAIARRDVGGVVAAVRQRIRLEPVDVLQPGGRGKRVPVEVEPRRLEHLADFVTLVEGPRRENLLDQILRDRLAGFVVDGVVWQDLRIERPILVELRGELDEVAGDVGPRDGR